MFKKKNKLTKKEFEFIFKKGEKKHSNTFLFISTKSNNSYKIGVSVPKKHFKKAVLRNKNKRTIYQFLKKIDLPDTNIIIVLKKNFNHNSKKEWQNEIINFLKNQND